MFKINERPEFTRTVTVMTPEGDGHREDTLIATYRVTETDEREVVTRKGMAAFLREAIVHLGDIADAEGNPLEYSAEVRDAVLASDGARLALMRKYSEEATRLKLGN